MKFDSIIFDLDGTLWDSTVTVAESWNDSLRRLGYDEPIISAEDIASIMGMTESQIAKVIFYPHFGEDATRICAICLEEEVDYIAIHGGRLYEGVRELPEKFPSLPFFIVSNCQKGYIEAFLSYTGFGKHFRDFECIGRSGLSKAENIALVIKRNALKAPVYIGDTASDEKSAAAAGCSFIHAAYGFGKAAEPVFTINQVTELFDKLL